MGGLSRIYGNLGYYYSNSCPKRLHSDEDRQNFTLFCSSTLFLSSVPLFCSSVLFLCSVPLFCSSAMFLYSAVSVLFIYPIPLFRSSALLFYSRVLLLYPTTLLLLPILLCPLAVFFELLTVHDSGQYNADLIENDERDRYDDCRDGVRRRDD
jgi:hypothetical protein